MIIMTEASLVVRGDIVTPEAILRDGWVAVADEQIVGIGRGAAPAAQSVHDVSGSLVLPGAIDGQTHAGSQFGFAGMKQTTESAIAGGVTTIVDMPYDNPDPIVSLTLLQQKIASVNASARCDVALYATITGDSDLVEVERMIEAGACAFKISSFENHPVRFPRITNGRALSLLTLLADTDIPVGLHNEDEEIIRATLAEFKDKGLTGAEFHDPSRPEVAELVATAAFLELGRATGAHVHLVHLSSPKGFELVRRYQADGTRATGEMCIHYLIFDAAEDISRLGALMKVNPPIRSGMRGQLWAELLRPAVEFVSSDHSAWPIERKNTASAFDAAAGVPGLETLLPAFYTGAARRGYDAELVTARYLSERPARFFGLWPRKGSIVVGADADFAILSNEAWPFDASKTRDGLNWSPYDGEIFDVRPQATYLRGQLAWSAEIPVRERSRGTFIPRLPCRRERAAS
jgi:allantoinase